ncbi:MAG: hypothetical protein WCC59_02455 [Terriglobales bacterium]
MAGQFHLKAVWNHKDFSVQRARLSAKGTLPGPELGDGVIYYSGLPTVKQNAFVDTCVKQAVLGETGRSLMYLFNPTDLSEIVNPSKKPIDLFKVELNYDPKLKRVLSKDSFAAATTFLLHGDWPEAFKSSVRTDLQAIGTLAKSFTASATPSPGDILRAERAKEDLEFKLQWFGAASRKLGPAYQSFWSLGGAGGGRGSGGSGGAGRGGGRLRPRPKGHPLDPFVKVTVNTKGGADGKTDVPACEVWANEFGYGDDLRKALRFARLSTPTTERLHVGKYTMWAQKGKAKGTILAIGIGKAFEREQTVDLLAPEP